MAARVTHNPDELRYELWLDERRVGELRYTVEDDGSRLALLHTEIDPSLEGRGLGGELVAGALADIRARGLAFTPVCPFVVDYLRRHPDASS